MTTEQAKNIVRILINKGIHFDIGLTDDEVLQIETKFNFKFPPDLKHFLQIGLPASDGFVNWRLGLKTKNEADKIFERLDLPLKGMLFDMQYNNFWSDSWGVKPENYGKQVEIAEQHYQTYPKLIPVFLHRYIPCQPSENNNPIFSVHQMDIIYYGINLENYFANEFGYTESGNYDLKEYPEKKIEFWSRIAEDEDIYN